jgi:heterodisulfide reductase subunit C
MSVINFDFRNEVLKYNASLSYCYQCSTCSGGCPVAFITNGFYNPRKIIELSILGLQDKLINDQDPNVWLCCTCQNCVELCPQNVELTEIFTLIKNLSFEQGKVPENFISQGETLFENGIAIPYSNAILTRRKNLGLPEIKIASTEDIKKLLKETNFEKNLMKGVSE